MSVTCSTLQCLRHKTGQYAARNGWTPNEGVPWRLEGYSVPLQSSGPELPENMSSRVTIPTGLRTTAMAVVHVSVITLSTG